ncbi:MAG: hypothetical protein IID48_19850, partial [Proteobacteria bacterium]|nr:hypothetical protein [Pseudomonadota bacterium]
MEVTFNPKAAAHNPNARAPQTQSTPATTAPEGSDDSVAITLSPAAKQVLKAGASEYTGKSPAHMARQFIADSPAGASAAGADGPDLSGPFGQIVKTFAPGHNKEPEIVEEPDAVPEDGGDTTVVDGGDGTGTTGTTEAGDTTVVDGTDGTGGTGTTEGGDTTVVDGTGATEGGDTTVADGSDDTVGPILVVDEPDVTEVLDDSAPAEGGVTEPESGIAGSGDAVASSGDDAPVDDGTSVDSVAPVAVVDTGDLT